MIRICMMLAMTIAAFLVATMDLGFDIEIEV